MRTAYPLDSAVRLLARRLPDGSRDGYRGQYLIRHQRSDRNEH
ncbi:hypothetical protein PGPR2_19675 [Pseudomonas aeruginosa PGPR2]|nr:hypothetical protein PGPR2_19675 [Pseudomonas aeruginosa PGPR2]